MSEENQQDSAQKEYSEEELAKMRDKMTKFYKDEAKHLQPQAAYYRLLAEIEENKVRRYSAMAQGAHMYAQAEQAENEAKAAMTQAKAKAEAEAAAKENGKVPPNAPGDAEPKAKPTPPAMAEKAPRKLKKD